ncbi:MAG TPA: methyltransferase domain-containing protein [Firmicutes bacterium]|nr:methyltransferase domain-containing protein [Bacillota bacterium]
MDASKLTLLADFWPARIILSAVELELFPKLAQPAQGAELARRLELDERATVLLLDALTALGVLEKSSGSYGIAPGLRNALLPGEDCILPSLRHRAVLWHRWSALTEVVTSGTSTEELYEKDQRPLEEVRSFIAAMAVSGRPSAGQAAAALDLVGVESLLDIGGGPGVYAREFLGTMPGLRVTILDLPRVCDIARENLSGTDYADRVEFAEGEALTIGDDMVLAHSPGGYGMVLASNLIHSMEEERVRELLRRAVRWCAPGGSVVIKDFFLDDTRTSPASAALFSINMLVNNAGRSYAWSEVERWLGEALDGCGVGGGKLQRIELPDGRSGMVVATKG